MGMGYDIVKEWVRSNKPEVCDIARRKSFGGFTIALTRLFEVADEINREIILDTWPHEFKKLYQSSDTHQHNMDKAEHDAQEDNYEKEERR